MYDKSFLNLSGNIVQKSEAKRSEDGARTEFIYQTSSKAGRSPGRPACQSRADRPDGRPVCTNVHRVARSTARSTVAGEWSTTRSADWHEKLSVGHDRSDAWSVPTGESGRGSASPFRIRTLFLNWRRIQFVS